MGLYVNECQRVYLIITINIKNIMIIEEIISFIRNSKDDWQRSDVCVSFKDISSELANKASRWFVFQDGSGEAKLYEENTKMRLSDLALKDTAIDAAAGVAALAIPIVGPLITTGIVASRGLNIAKNSSWKNTYIFIFDSGRRNCVFAVEFHYSANRQKRISMILDDIERRLEP